MFILWFLLLFSILPAIYGLVLFVFRKGKRIRSLYILGQSIITFFVCMIAIVYTLPINEGFESRNDKKRAEEAGILDADEWAVVKAEEEAKRLEAKKQAAEKIAAQEEAARKKAEQIAAENAFYFIPPAQIYVIDAIVSAREAYKSAKNDLAKGGVRRI